MDPYYRFFPFRNPLALISWNAAWGYDTYERLVEQPAEAERAREIRNRQITRMLADGITHSVLDESPDRVPHFCYLGFALGDYGIRPLEDRFRLRWYPVYEVRVLWEKNPAEARAALEKTSARIERKYGVVLKRPVKGVLP